MDESSAPRGACQQPEACTPGEGVPAGYPPLGQEGAVDRLTRNLVDRMTSAVTPTDLVRATGRARSYATLPEKARQAVTTAQAQAYIRIHRAPGPRTARPGRKAVR